MELTRDEEQLLQGEKRYFPSLPTLGGWYTDEEYNAVMSSFKESMDWKTGFHGPEIDQFEQAFAEYCDVKHAVAYNSCGTGLDAAMQALHLEPGDEVIVPGITFTATALCVLGAGGNVRLAEIDPKTFNLDPNDVERRVNKNTRAILAVHNNGLSADMDALEEIGQRHPHAKHGPLPVIGDAARAVGAGYKGTKVGKKGAMNIFSFQTTKNMTTLGEGGMVTTDDDDYATFVKRVRSFGAREAWGTNYRMTKLQAVAGSVQLRRLDEMNRARYERALQLAALLQDVPGLTLPTEPEGYDHVWYGYTVMLEPAWAGEPRDRVVKTMVDEYGAGAVVMNASLPDYVNFLRKVGLRTEDVPVSTDAGRRLFCPALHPLMSEEDLRYLVAALKASMIAVSKSMNVPAGVR